MKIKNYKISWRHHNHNDVRLKTFKLDKVTTTGPSFGQTDCYLSDINNPNDIIIGEAYCTPNDNYNKRLGRYISFKRAVDQIPNKDIRKELWAEILSTNIVKK